MNIFTLYFIIYYTIKKCKAQYIKATIYAAGRGGKCALYSMAVFLLPDERDLLFFAISAVTSESIRVFPFDLLTKMILYAIISVCIMDNVVLSEEVCFRG